MNYILKNLIYEGSPKVSEDGLLLTQKITIITGIEGDLYGFTRTDFFEVSSSMSKTGNEIKADILDQATQRISQLYPNS